MVLAACTLPSQEEERQVAWQVTNIYWEDYTERPKTNTHSAVEEWSTAGYFSVELANVHVGAKLGGWATHNFVESRHVRLVDLSRHRISHETTGAGALSSWSLGMQIAPKSKKRESR